MEPATRANTKTRLVNLGIDDSTSKRDACQNPLKFRTFPKPRVHIERALADKTGADPPSFLIMTVVGQCSS